MKKERYTEERKKERKKDKRKTKKKQNKETVYSTAPVDWARKKKIKHKHRIEDKKE